MNPLRIEKVATHGLEHSQSNVWGNAQVGLLALCISNFLNGDAPFTFGCHPPAQ